MHFVYVLFCKDRRLYIGYTKNLQERFTAHQGGKVRSTRHRLPIKLIYYEHYCNSKDARAREIYLKSGGGHHHFKRQHKNQLIRLGYKHL